MRIGRRALWAGAAALATGAAAEAAPRAVALDFGLTETLLALGVVPLGLPSPREYRLWVVRPELPPGPVDLGQRTQPNLELLGSLRPDLILCIQDHDPIERQLRAIAPVLRLPIYTAERDPWRQSVRAALEAGERLGRPGAARALIGRTERRLDEARARLAARPQRPVLLASLLDARHLLVFGAGSLGQAVLDRLGLRNGWTGPTGVWGSASVGVDALSAAGDATLFTIDPRPQGLDAELNRSPLWNALPFVRENRVVALPPVLMFGTLPAAGRLAELMLPHLPGGDARG